MKFSGTQSANSTSRTTRTVSLVPIARSGAQSARLISKLRIGKNIWSKKLNHLIVKETAMEMDQSVIFKRHHTDD